MILVTGGTGLVGAYLLLYLVEKEEKVRAIYRNEINLEKTKSLFKIHNKENLFEKIEWIQADILDVPSLETAFKNIDFVYHCAGLISFDPNDEEILRKTNIEGTANIVNFCIDYNVKKLCHVSSIAALGNPTSDKKQITEETEWNPEFSHSDYAISKYGAEMEVWRGYQEGLDVVIVNPGVILGSTIWTKGSGAIFTKVKKGLSFFTKGETGYVGINDVITIMIQLMQSDIKGERFTIVSENLSYEKTLKTIAFYLQVKKPSIYISQWLTAIAWRMDWFMNTFFRTKRFISKHSATSLHSTDNYSNEKIKNALNFEFQSIDNIIKEIVSTNY